MPRKAVARLFLLALIVSALYFLIFRNGGNNAGFRGRTAPHGNEPSVSSRPFSLPHKRSTRKRAEKQEPEFGAGSEVACNSEYFAAWQEPAEAACRVRIKNNYPVPDPECTPGGVNPSVSIDVLRDPNWRTRSIRNCESSEAQKHIAYGWYEIQKPRINSNQNQVCELDHLVPLELGGADGLGNIWPECGPDAVALTERYFKQKDHVENYLAAEVKSGHISLNSAQRGIADDWTQYLPAATRWCQQSRRC